MDLEQLRTEWSRLGTTDPLWAVLSNPGKRGGLWEPAEFFETGVDDVRVVLDTIAEAGVSVARGRALDFGCGVGRLTQALAAQFDEVVGVDIAESMLEQARRFDRSDGRCSFAANTSADLKQFASGSFDFIYSHIVFQHMEPRYALGYMREFARLLRPNGVTVFQTPVPDASGRLSDRIKQRFPAAVRALHRMRHPGQPIIEMYAVPQRDIESALAAGGVRIFTTKQDPNGRPGTHGMVFYGQKTM
jgi:SAM-dependent methyltransferase